MCIMYVRRMYMRNQGSLSLYFSLVHIHPWPRLYTQMCMPPGRSRPALDRRRAWRRTRSRTSARGGARDAWPAFSAKPLPAETLGGLVFWGVHSFRGKFNPHNYSTGGWARK